MDPDTRLQSVTLTVPADRVGDLMRYAASLFDTPPAQPVTPAVDGSLRRNVARAFLGGKSNAWRPLLRYLAAHPGEWVAWPDICKAIRRTRKQASGALGAAERRCQNLGYVPYTKRRVAGEHEFFMEPEVAAIIRDLDNGQEHDD